MRWLFKGEKMSIFYILGHLLGVAILVVSLLVMRAGHRVLSIILFFGLYGAAFLLLKP